MDSNCQNLEIIKELTQTNLIMRVHRSKGNVIVKKSVKQSPKVKGVYLEGREKKMQM